MPVTPTLQSHDILLTDYADTPVTLGLVIEKDKNGIPLFPRFRFPAESLSQQQFQSFSQGIFPPQYQGFITQKTWHGGFGKQTLTGLGTDNRYLQSLGVDCSVKGLKYPSPVPVATTNTTATYAAPSVANGDMELTTGWTLGTNWSYSAAAARGGSKGLLSAGGNTVTNYTYQNLVQVDRPLYVGLTITLSIWAKKAAAGSGAEVVRLSLQDTSANDIATSGNVVVTTSWAEYTVAFVILDTTAVGLRFTIGAGQGTADIYVDDATVTLGAITTGTTPGTIVKMIDFNSNHYAVSDTGVWKRTAANWARVTGPTNGASPAGITDCASDGTNLYLAKGTSLYMWYMDTNEDCSRIDQTNSRCSHLAWINGFMYGITSATNLRQFTSITAGTITADDTIGQTGYSVTALVNHLELATVVKTNWAGYVNSSGTVVDIVSELASMDNANTGKNAISWRGNGAQTFYIPAGGGASLLAYDAGDVTNIGPDVYAERLSDFKGQIVAQVGDDQWDYIILDNSTKIEILKGRYEAIDGATDFRWHPIIEDTYTTVAGAHISSITAKRLYYWGGTALPKYIPLPVAYGDPINDSNLTFNTAVTDESSWFDLNLPRITKTYLNFTLDSVGLSATKTVKIEYQLWESQGTWTELGGSGNGSFTTSPTQTKTFAINISGRKIRFRFTYTTDNTAVGYGVYEFTCRLALNPSRLNIYTATVRVGNKNKLKGAGDRDTEMIYSKVAPQLHTWADTQPLLLSYWDGQLTGAGGFPTVATEEVKFMEGYPRETKLSLGNIKQAGEAPESLFEIALISIDRSVS